MKKLVWLHGIPIFTWNDNAVTVKVNDFEDHIRIPNKIRLGYIQAFQLSKLLKGPYTMQLFIKDNDFAHCLVQRVMREMEKEISV